MKIQITLSRTWKFDTSSSADASIVEAVTDAIKSNYEDKEEQKDALADPDVWHDTLREILADEPEVLIDFSDVDCDDYDIEVHDD